MMHGYRIKILFAVLLFLLLTLFFTIVQNVSFIPSGNNEHTEGTDLIETKEISIEEFIEMTTRTPEEAEELRKVFNSQD